jgi:cytochrome c oxidase subunit IV
MTEHVVHEPAHGDAHDHSHDDHGHGEHHGHDNSPEAIKREMRRYLMVLGALAVLTVITVAIARLHLPTGQAIALALAVATVKASLVAAFFMHLISERRLIFAVLIFSAFFFGLMIWGPWHQRSDARKQWKGYDMNASAPTTSAETDHKGTGH